MRPLGLSQQLAMTRLFARRRYLLRFVGLLVTAVLVIHLTISKRHHQQPNDVLKESKSTTVQEQVVATKNHGIVSFVWSGMCQHLSGSLFNLTTMTIYSETIPKEYLERSLMESVNKRAEEIRRLVLRKAPAVQSDSDDLIRYCCYHAVLDDLEGYAEQGLLYDIDLANYFAPMRTPNLPFQIVYQGKIHDIVPGKRWQERIPTAQIAYLLLTNGNVDPNLEKIKKLVRLLHVPGQETDSFTLIHVDADSTDLHKQLVSYLLKEKPKHVALLMHSIPVRWGKVEMVTVELEGYFALHAIANWDFVINLSTSDYPLRTSRYIRTKLETDHIYIHHWRDEQAARWRVEAAEFPLNDTLSTFADWTHLFRVTRYFKTNRNPTVDPLYGIQRMKHDQWMILPYNYIGFMKDHGRLWRLLLARMAEGSIMDEGFFIFNLKRYKIISDDEKFKDAHNYWMHRVINSHKRYISPFGKDAHPIPITDVKEIKEAMLSDEVFFARKLDILNASSEVVQWMDKVRQSELARI